jgi:hypothetical protein
MKRLYKKGQDVEVNGWWVPNGTTGHIVQDCFEGESTCRVSFFKSICRVSFFNDPNSGLLVPIDNIKCIKDTPSRAGDHLKQILAEKGGENDG